jgi:hypothetical protein
MMKHNFRRSALALSSLLVACASAHDKSTTTAGTETDNPVVTTSSPADFTTPVAPPGCPPIPGDEMPNFPDALPRSALIATERGNVLALASGGLTLLDLADPAHPLTLSEGSVRGTISQLLVSASGKLWVAATEAPEFDPNGVPSAEELAAHSRVILFDVSDPTAPARLAQAELSGDFWQLQERGDQIWALTARHVAKSLQCDAPRSFCYGPGYEAVTLRGFRATAGALQPVAEAELPFDRRLWWNGDGVASALEDGSLHVLSWDEAGALRAPLALNLPEAGAVPGPVRVIGNELSVVSVGSQRTFLHVYNLASGAAAPERSFALGDPSIEAVYVASGSFSLFSGNYLWLEAPQGGTAPAQVWDVSGSSPAKLELPGNYTTILPIPGAVLEGHEDELLALALSGAPIGSQLATLLSFKGASIVNYGAAPAGAQYIPYSNRGNPIPAPANVQGSGDAPAWNLFSRGPGLPIGIDPATPPAAGQSAVGASVAIERSGAEPAQASIVADYVYDSTHVKIQPNPRLQITSDGNTISFELSPGASTLLAIPQGVLAIAPDLAQCQQSERDCTGYAPGVQVFEVSGTPQLRASMPFPQLPLPPLSDPKRLDVRWEDYGDVSRILRPGLLLDDRHIAFVAQVELSCDTQESCDALGLEAVPLGEANVIPTSRACPPGGAPGCVEGPVTLTVYGSGQRQYFYVLDLDAEGGPAWQFWGISSLEATAARSDDGSRFASAFATQGTLAATRLERGGPSGSLPNGSFRFMLDRFERDAAGGPIALPPVNIPGYPVAKLGGPASSERWISIEPAPGANGHARVYRLDLRSDGAHIEQSLKLDDGSVSGFLALQSGDRWFGVALSSPANACGTTQLSALELGSAAGDANEALGITSALELPADEWLLVAADQNRALLRHDQVYTLVELASDGSLSVVSSRSSDLPGFENYKLVGKSLFGAADFSGARRIDF